MQALQKLNDLLVVEYTKSLMSSTIKILEKGELTVYCTKCGTNNAEGATICVDCSAPLYGANPEGKTYWGHIHYKSEYNGFHRTSALTTLIIGIVIVFVGFSFLLNEIFNIHIPWWEIIIILIGIWFIKRALVLKKCA